MVNDDKYLKNIYNTITSGLYIASAHFDSIFKILHAEKRSIDIMANPIFDDVTIDKIIKNNYDILYDYRFKNIEYYKLLDKKYYSTYYKHAKYTPLDELNISPLTRIILILKIYDIIYHYNELSKDVI